MMSNVTMRMYIDGQWVEGSSNQTRKIINPATGEIVAHVTEGTRNDAQKAIEAARRTFDEGFWSGLSARNRSDYLYKIADEIEKHAGEFAHLETLNNGKPLRESRSDVDTAIDCFRYYAGLIRKPLGDTFDSSMNSMVVYEPMGVCGQIVPWNFPLQMAAWKIAPCLAAGNVTVFKPSELTPLTAIRLFDIFDRVGLPKGVANLVLGSGQEVGNHITISPLVDKVSFTGGTETGKKIMMNGVETIKNMTLELGGKSAIIVFPDVDLEETVEYIMFAIFLGAGQVCSAGSRLIIHEDLHDRFVEKLVEHTKKIRVGHGLEEETEMGPLSSEQHLQKVLDYVRIGVEEGATLVTGGHRITNGDKKKGYFMEPTIFTDVSPDMRIVREEIFGPVLVIQKFETEKEAISLANDTNYGLAGAVFTGDFSRAMRVSKSLQAGTVWINKYHSVDNQLPWGGYKQSGIGRDLGAQALNEYMEVKVVQMNLQPSPLKFYKSFR